MHDASVQLRGSGVQSFVAGVQSHAWWREGGGIWAGGEGVHDGVCGSPCRWSWMVTGWHFTSLMVFKVRNSCDLQRVIQTVQCYFMNKALNSFVPLQARLSCMILLSHERVQMYRRITHLAICQPTYCCTVSVRCLHVHQHSSYQMVCWIPLRNKYLQSLLMRHEFKDCHF